MRGERDEARRPPPSIAFVTLGAAGATLAAALCGVWVLRAPLAERLTTGWLSGRGVDAALTIDSIDFYGVRFSGLRLGPADSPQAGAQSGAIFFGWDWLWPHVRGVSLGDATLRADLKNDRVSFGALDALLPPPSGTPFEAPAMGFNVSNMRVTVTTPAGPVDALVSAAGALRGDLRGRVDLLFQPPDGEALAARLGLQGNGGTLTITALVPDATTPLSLVGAIRAPWALKGSAGQFAVQIPSWDMGDGQIRGVSGTLDLDFADPGVLRLSGEAQSLALGALEARGARFEASVAMATGGFGANGEATLEQLSTPWAVLGDSQIHASLSNEPGEGATVGLQFRRGVLTETGQATVRSAWLGLPGTPAAPLLDDALARALAAGRRFSSAAQFTVEQRDGGWTISLAQPAVTVTSASGETATFATRGGAPAPAFDAAGGAFSASGVFTFNEAAQVDVECLRVDGGGIQAKGLLVLPDWRAGGAALRAPGIAFEVSTTPTERTITVSGPMAASGPVAGGVVDGLSLPADMTITLPAVGGMSVIADAGRPVTLRFAAFTLPGVRFENGSVALRPLMGPALFTAFANGALSGGARIGALSWTGATTGADASPIALQARQIDVMLTNTLSAPGADTQINELAFLLTLSPERTVSASAPEVTAALRSAGGSWRIDGTFAGASVLDHAAAAFVDDGAGTWAGAPEGDRVVFSVSNANARAQDALPIGKTPRFEPLRISALTATLRDGVAQAEGLVSLDDNGQPLGRISATHALADARGSLRFVAEGLRFSHDLTPVQISEFARGVIIALDGVIDMNADATWEGEGFAAEAQARYAFDSASTQSLPIIRGVEGQIVFDDLIALSTPPGQTVTLALLNPGVAVETGAVRFQLLPGGRVALEDARWRFAGGALSVEPAVIQLGAESTMLNLTLAEVDISTVLASLNIPDLTMTGRVEGRFPLEITKTASWIRDGALTSVGGGTIQYSGAAGASATGVSRLAFDALKNFRYIDFTATLNGNLADDVDIGLRFTGLTIGEDLDLSSIVPLPGGQSAMAPNVPFRFNIAVNAPFRSLLDTASGISDGRRLARPLLQQRAISSAEEPVDPRATPQP